LNAVSLLSEPSVEKRAQETVQILHQLGCPSFITHKYILEVNSFSFFSNKSETDVLGVHLGPPSDGIDTARFALPHGRSSVH
jgi:hypothetical protein